ncbi:MAG: cobyrinate a,c-diamide synthase [Bacteroidales bacterium]|nr:cobyrinate a,c-diamide synthase [Bacteroidales bacterium]
MIPQLLIGALSSGSGKTTVTMGLLRALRRRGLNVQPFKCGPDYIDTQFHAIASGSGSVNLDTWLSSESHLLDLYARYGVEADACVAEGVMGLFDGYDRMKGSSAEIARLLGIPVVLVVNGKSMAYTVAAQLAGVRDFAPGVRIAGVIFNRVSCGRHAGFMRQACEDVGLPCFGTIPQIEGLEIPSRHLGLTLSAKAEMDALCDRAADAVEANIDIDALLKSVSMPFKVPSAGTEPTSSGSGLRIAVARDEAFNFIYRENLAQLKRLGKVSFFSPLAGEPLPPADLLYLPGGYPELFAEQLSQQRVTMAQIRDFAESGGRILAECGGMIYLCKGIEEYPLCGVLPMTATMEGARLHLGYRRVAMPSGTQWRGHEFHYSKLTGENALPSVAQQFNAQGEEVSTALFRYKNTIAGYTHLYWGEADILKLWE